MLLENKTAVITGSNKGIGLEILKNFSKNKANISGTCKNIRFIFRKIF
jgi:NAD(P)-dependent dehydrogenase (short-subunit alcohol dehydrogenase family)